MTLAARSVERLGVYNRPTTDNINNDNNRCQVCSKRTPLEKRLENACSKFPGHRTATDVSSVASQLMAIPAFEHTPGWKVKRLARNMAAVFVREGNDAALLCSDPSFTYFVVTGSLMPVATTAEHAPSLLAVSRPDSGAVDHSQSSHDLAVSSPNGSSSGGHAQSPGEGPRGVPLELSEERPVSCPSGGSGGHPHLPDDRTSGGLPAFPHKGGAVSRPNNSGVKNWPHSQFPDEKSGAVALWRSTEGRKGHQLLLPGQSLDVYLRGQTNKEVDSVAENNHEKPAYGSPRNVYMGKNIRETMGHGSPSNDDMGKNKDGSMGRERPGTDDMGKNYHKATGHGRPRNVGMGNDDHEAPGHESPRKVNMGKNNHGTTGSVSPRNVDMGNNKHETTGHGSPTLAVDGSGRLRWRLEAREAACVGKVSKRFLQELELEEPRRDLDQKVAFLRRTEMFSEGFSTPILERLAMLMERREQACSRVVMRKGSAVDKVIVVQSGEAVRVEDHAAESGRKATSLYITSGAIFGAEEAMSRLPTYTSSLMATTTLRFFVVPVSAFLRAVDGVRTAALSRLNSRACLARHRHEAGTDAALPGMLFSPPMATVDSDREYSLRGSSGASADPSLWPVLRPSLTRQPRVRLTPAPFFSEDAAKGYRRITGALLEMDLEDRINSMAAMWTPWSWSDPTATAQRQRSRSSPTSRPESAPASTTKRPETPFHLTHQLPRAASRSPSTSRSPSASRPPPASTSLPSGARWPSALISRSATRSPYASRSPSFPKSPSPPRLQQAQETLTTRTRPLHEKKRASTAGIAVKNNSSVWTGDRAEASPNHASTRRGDQVEASPEFRLLGPSACEPLVGCPESMRHLGRESSTADDSRDCCSSSNNGRFRPETLMNRKRATGGQRQQQAPRKHRNNVRSIIGVEEAAAEGGGVLYIGSASIEKKKMTGVGELNAISSSSNESKNMTGGGEGGGGVHIIIRRTSSNENNKNNSSFVPEESMPKRQQQLLIPAAKQNEDVMREKKLSKLSIPTAKTNDVVMLEGIVPKVSIPAAAAAAAAPAAAADADADADADGLSEFDEDDDDTAAGIDSSFSEGELISSGILCSTSSSLSTQSSSSGTLTHIADTLLMWDQREIAVAERAVSARVQRKRLCRAFRAAGEWKLAAMPAAQRAYRGAFVMSKMGDARARSKWRP